MTACSDRSERAGRYAAEAERHLGAGNLLAARESIRDAIAERDDLTALHLLRGRIELAGGAYSNAFEAYYNALALDNTSMEALQGISQLGLRTGNLRESLDATEKILALAPDEENALVARGIHALVRRRFEEAVGYGDRILEAHPSSEAGAILKARALFLSGKPIEALDALEALERNAPDAGGVALTKLEIYREGRDADAMQAQFDRLRQLQPDNAAFRIDEANLHFKLGKRRSAQTILLDLLSRSDLERQSAREAIGLFDDYGAYELPEAPFQRALETASVGTLVELTRGLIEAKQAELAQLALRKLPPRDVRPLAARLAVLNGRPAEATRLASEVLYTDETQCDALIARGQAALLQGDSAGALRDSQHAAAECPDQRMAWLTAAAAYSAQEELTGAERMFRDGAEANPQDFAITNAYGDWLANRDRDREALAVARRLTRNSPAFLRGWRYYVSLCARREAGCADEARHGLADAQTRYGVDLKPGELPPYGLFGRLVRW